jgi:dihydropteroate synthase
MSHKNNINFFEPQVMAIVNVTDDSFYGGSRTLADDDIMRRVSEVISQGATIVDVGGYSSRPGAKDITAEQEWERVRRGLQAVRAVSKDVVVSVDTFREEVARRAFEEFGWLIVNDISAGELSPAMVEFVAEAKIPYVAMHMRGTPQTMQQMTEYGQDVVSAVKDYFCQRLEYLAKKGVESIILDPGFGFAKSVEQNYQLLARLNEVCAMGYPVLAGLSRKSMIYKPLGVAAEDALAGTVALNWEALRQGATILRVHDVREAVEQITLHKMLVAAAK